MRGIASPRTSWTISTSSSTSSPGSPASAGPEGPTAIHLPPSARLGALGIIHPFPTILVALSTGALALIAGGTGAEAVVLAVAMAGFQSAIGAVNDLHDVASDAIGQPWKPLPAGRLSPRAARVTAVVGAALGVVGSAALGLGVLVVGLVGFSLGLAYDVRLKRTAWGWLCFAIALPLIPVYAWLGVGAGAPPEMGTLFLLGGLAGLELALANGLVDEGPDRRAGAQSLAIRLGPRLARVTMAGAAIAILVVAWASLLGGGVLSEVPTTMPFGAVLALGSVMLVVGVAMALRRDPAWSWRGWQVQAVGVALLALAWLTVSVEAGLGGP